MENNQTPAKDESGLSSTEPTTMTLWAVVTPEGEPMPFTARETKEYAIYLNYGRENWFAMLGEGYTCQQFDVTFKPKESDSAKR